MEELREIFRFSRAELIALSVLLSLALVGGGILLLERMQEQIPADVVFEPIELTRSSSAVISAGSERTARASSNRADPTSRDATLSRHWRADLKININTAPAESLVLLPHVGSVIGARIIEYREARGGFESPDQLIAIRGIGPKYLQDILPYITAE